MRCTRSAGSSRREVLLCRTALPLVGAHVKIIHETATKISGEIHGAIKKDDVQLYVNKERTQVVDWAKGEKLYLAVLIDDSLDSSIRPSTR